MIFLYCILILYRVNITNEIQSNFKMFILVVAGPTIYSTSVMHDTLQFVEYIF